MDQFEKAARFKALHERKELFVIPNPWDAGSARLLAAMGFEALTTTSGGLAFGLGQADGVGLVSREDCIANAALIAGATELPVAADLENGYGDSPDAVAECIRLAAGAGLVGGSIEDATGRPDEPLYAFELAVERVAAAAEVARALPFPFTFVARAENFLHGRPDLDDTIRRLQAYEEAGADVLFAPGLPSLEAIRTVCASVSKPVNLVQGFGGVVYPLADLEAAGVRRVSVGGLLARVALTGLRNAAQEIREHGTFSFVEGTMTMADITPLMQRR